MTPLRQRLIEDPQLRNRSPKTIKAYVYHVCVLARYYKQTPDQIGDERIHRYVLHLLHLDRCPNYGPGPHANHLANDPPEPGRMPTNSHPGSFMTGTHTNPTTLLGHNPRRLGLVADAPRRPTETSRPSLRPVTIGAIPSMRSHPPLPSLQSRSPRAVGAANLTPRWRNPLMLRYYSRSRGCGRPALRRPVSSNGPLFRRDAVAWSGSGGVCGGIPGYCQAAEYFD